MEYGQQGCGWANMTDFLQACQLPSRRQDYALMEAF